MATDSFFDGCTEQSKIKSEIVSKYFWSWAKVIIPSAKSHNGRIAYIDLFAGPGRYNDGTISTPLLILERAIKDNDMQKMLVTLFNDADKGNAHSLEKAIKELPGIETLKYQPQIQNAEIGGEIVAMFERMKLVPTLFFVDPWGYKGLSLQLVNSVLKNWGCDCIFFFNYNRINMGLTNPRVEEHMNALFGKERADLLRNKLNAMNPHDREFTVVEELVNALKEMSGKYILPFCFKNELGTRTSHHLIFISKNFRGYEIMKEIMAKESSSSDQGVASFQYNLADIRFPSLFSFTQPLDELEEKLLVHFSGRSIKMENIYLEHCIGTPYIKRNYKAALIRLEQKGKIIANPQAGQRKKHKGEISFADNVFVTFPKR